MRQNCQQAAENRGVNHLYSRQILPFAPSHDGGNHPALPHPATISLDQPQCQLRPAFTGCVQPTPPSYRPRLNAGRQGDGAAWRHGGMAAKRQSGKAAKRNNFSPWGTVEYPGVTRHSPKSHATRVDHPASAKIAGPNFWCRLSSSGARPVENLQCTSPPSSRICTIAA